MHVWTTCLVLTLTGAWYGCSRVDGPTHRKKPTVYTTFYPTRYFAERIGAEHMEVICPVPEGADPILWIPSAQTIRAYQQADLVVINGAGYEHWLSKVSLPPSKVVDTTRGMAKDLITLENAVTHSHGPDGAHTHEGLDGHTWLDPVLATAQVRAIRRALAKLMPEEAGTFQANTTELLAELDELDRAFARLTQTLNERPLLASHPAYNYLARRYGWSVTNLALDPQTVPEEAQLAELEKIVRQHDSRVLLWEREPRPEVATRLERSLGLRSVVFSPCELLGEAAMRSGEDYLGVMQQNIERLLSVTKGMNEARRSAKFEFGDSAETKSAKLESVQEE